MGVIVILAALGLLVFTAYRGFSVILMAPICALLAILFTSPALVAPVFSGVFLDAMAGFLRTYFPVFLLGALFGKLMEMAGLSAAIAIQIVRLVGPKRAILATVLMCALMTYGGVSVFVVVFTVYPLAAVLFRQADIPKRLLPASMALGSFTFSMDAMPGSPQVQNIIPTTFFNTTAWAAPMLGLVGGAAILAAGLTFLEWRRRAAGDEGYGEGHTNEPVIGAVERLPNGYLAFLPLITTLVANFILTQAIPAFYGSSAVVDLPGLKAPLNVSIPAVTGIWAVEAALMLGCLVTVLLGWRPIRALFSDGSKAAVGGAMLASINIASEFGFGAVMAALPGFNAIRNAMAAIPDPLVNQAVTITTLAGVTGSGAGGLSLSLAALGDQFLARGVAAGIPPEVLHRVAAMACGGMDTLPHNGAVITLLAVVGLTHRQAYKDIFAITLIKTAAVFFVIGLHYATGLV